MNTTAQHIAHLLPHTPYVEVCGLGVFGRVCISASYNAETGAVTPPSERIGFEYRPDVDTSAALIDSLCRQGDMDEAEARKSVLADVRGIRETLSFSGRYCIEGIGMLRQEDSGEISFECSADYLGSTAACWLPALGLNLLDQSVPMAAEKASRAEEALRESQRRTVVGRSIRIAATWGAAVAVFAVIVMVTGWINRLDTGRNATVASALPVAVHAEAVTMPQAPETPLLLVFRTPADGVDEARVRPVANDGNVAGNTETLCDNGPYCLIVASLANMDEANAFVQCHATGSMPLDIVPVQGRIRISAMSGNDVAMLMGAARAAGIYDVYPNAWVCRR